MSCLMLAMKNRRRFWCLIEIFGIPSVEKPSPLPKDLMASFLEDRALGHVFSLPRSSALHPRFQLYNWWLSRVLRWERRQCGRSCWAGSKLGLAGMEGEVGDSAPKALEELYLGHVAHKRSVIPAIERNAGIARDFTRLVPRPMVIEVQIEGHKARALIDSGSLSDFMSTIHLAVQGSRSKINFGVKPRFEYQGIDERRYFDIANLSNYDVILGTPFLFQHKITIEGTNVSELASRSMELAEEAIADVRGIIIDSARARGLFDDAAKAPLPPIGVRRNALSPCLDNG